MQILNKDIRDLKLDDIQYPKDCVSKIDVVFMSPPWGGIGYNLVEEYKLEYLHPNFDETVRAALKFSGNLIFFLPKNTSVKELLDSVVPHAKEFNEDPDSRKNELIIEIE
jgi:hypothetical protein